MTFVVSRMRVSHRNTVQAEGYHFLNGETLNHFMLCTSNVQQYHRLHLSRCTSVTLYLDIESEVELQGRGDGLCLHLEIL